MQKSTSKQVKIFPFYTGNLRHKIPSSTVNCAYDNLYLFFLKHRNKHNIETEKARFFMKVGIGKVAGSKCKE